MRLLSYMEPFQMNLNWFPNVLYGFMFSISIYLAAYRNLDASTDFLEEKGSFGIIDEFDFIIVGAGSSGSILSNRLSAKNYSVLLLEAGGEPHPLHMIPLFAVFLLNYPEIDWQHKSVPQQHSTFAQHHRQSLLSQGKSLGGTSNINFMMHSRGNPKDFDMISELVDDPNWNYDNLLPFFKKHEDYISKPFFKYIQEGPDDVHGSGGELTIQVPPYTGMAETFLQATEELGYQRMDLNGRYTEGFDYTYTPMRFGRRQSTFTAFLEPIRDRSTLTIRKFAHVTQVLIGDNNTAYGVQYQHHGVQRYAHARREVILSSGSLNTPKLLMLSGIGPKEDLEDLGIPVRQDLPVGRNLQDHASTYLGPFFINESMSFNADRDLTSLRVSEFLARGTGPLTSPTTSAFGFLATDIAKAAGESDHPDIQLIFSGSAICKECDRFLAKGFNIKEDVLMKYFKHAKNRDGFLQIVSNARPKARGDVRLQSSDPDYPALIDPKYLDNEHDLKVTIAGVKKAIDLVENTTVFQQLGGHFTTEVFPGCEDVEFRSDAYWECYIRQFTVSLHHFVGSCSMSKSSETGVVDTKLRVFGINRLRVVDASILPTVPVGNTNSPAIMIGEKGADLILQLWENS